MRVCSSGRPGGFRGFSLPQAQARQGEGCGRIYPNSYRRRNWRPPLGESEADCPAAAWLDKAGRPGRNRGMRPEGGLRSRAKHRLICVTVAHGTCLGTAAACRAEQQCGPWIPNFRYLGLGQSTTDHDVQPNGPPGGLAGAARRPAVGRSESGSACRSLLGREAASATEDEESCSSRQLDRCRLRPATDSDNGAVVPLQASRILVLGSMRASLRSASRAAVSCQVGLDRASADTNQRRYRWFEAQ